MAGHPGLHTHHSVTVTSILRATSVQNSLKNKADITYNFINRGMWTVIEANLGIVSACLPVLKLPMSRLFPRLFGSTKKASSGYVAPGPSGRGYRLDNMDAKDSRQVVSVKGQDDLLDRDSDERYIMTNSVKGTGSDYDLDSNGSPGGRGISKQVDFVRTSFHELPR